MKKIINFISILIAAITLSSCVYVGSDTPVVIVPPTYSLTFNNQTSFDVADWYVQKTAGKKFYVDPNNTTPVWSHENQLFMDYTPDGTKYALLLIHHAQQTHITKQRKYG